MADLGIEFVSTKILSEMEDSEATDYLLKVIKKGDMVVLDEKLPPSQEKELFRKTMEMVDSKFTGIEISSIGDNKDNWKNSIIKLLGGKTTGLTVIGSAKIIKKIKNEKDKINLLAKMSTTKTTRKK
jgi:hypothetical protein